MYQPAALFIGLRYMRGRAADRFGRFVSWLSTIGITLGVMALVTVLSVMNGFERELQNNILGLMPQAILSAQQGSINPQKLPESAARLQGVTRVAPLTTGDVVLQSARSVAVGVMLGIDPAQKDPLTPYLVNVKQSDLQAGKYNVILGEQLAGQLGVNRGDRIRVMVPSASQFTPMGRLPSQRLFNVIGRFVSWLSTIGITLGVMALVTVLSVMNGFERELQNNILGLMPQAILSAQQGSINPQKLPESAARLQGVTRVAPLTTGDVVLQSARSVAVGVMLGIDPAQKDPLTPYLVNVKQSDLQAGKYNVILGEQLAGQLGVNRGDRIRVMVPSASQFTPMGRLPSQRLFNVIGTFAASSEVDGYQMLTNIDDASRLMRYPQGNITGWRLWLSQPLQVDTLSQQKLPEGTKWQDWRERKGELFQAVRMEKNMMGLLLSLIIAVAAFNIITSLGMMVMEKQGEVAILQTLGLTPRQIMLVFMVQGASAGIVGALLGAGLGALLASQLNNLMPIIGAFLDGAALPVAIEPLQVIVIALVAMALALLSTLYPSWRAAATQPAEALRYE